MADADAVVAALRRVSSKATRDGMARYGIPSDHALGVSMSAMQKIAKPLGRDHDLAAVRLEKRRRNAGD